MRDPNPPSFDKIDGFIEQHAIGAPRQLRPCLDQAPRVLIAILVRQEEPSLPLYLECIEALDYPKSSIVLCVHTHDNTDRTQLVLSQWLRRLGHLYAHVECEFGDATACLEDHDVHPVHYRGWGRIRNISLQKTLQHGCRFYFAADINNLVRPCTLRELVSLNVPIAAPFLRHINAGQFYSNYHAEIDANGYYAECDEYHWTLNRRVRGIIEMPVVHSTYLVRSDVIQHLYYDDGSGRAEYVIFSATARKANVLQYLDNRQIYGYITADRGGIEDSLESRLLRDDIEAERVRQDTLRKLRRTLSLLTSYQAVGFGMVRIGHDRDGGYVMLDDLDREIVCYSLGVAREISWDIDLAHRGAQIFQYDDSVDGPPTYHQNFHFRRVRIGEYDDVGRNTIRLDTIVKAAHLDGQYAILNMDIEGSEWGVIDSTNPDVFEKFAQILVEFHGLSKIREDDFNDLVTRVWKRLCMTHFPVHLHGNNWATTFAAGDFDCPDVLEVTFVNRSRYSPSIERSKFPSKLDKANRSDRPDYDLSRFPSALGSDD